MQKLTRRSVLQASLAAAAGAGTFARPYIARAAAKTASLWIAQGFVPEEDTAAKKLVADYEKQSGNKIDLSIVPFAPLRDKEVSAVTSGVVPDMMEWADNVFGAQQAWAGRLEDVSAIIDTQKSQFAATALAGANLYDSSKKERSYYGVPWKLAAVPFHIWISLVEKGGGKIADMPTTWTAFIDFFKPFQAKLKAQGMRHTYSYGMDISTAGVDSVNYFNAFMIAHGGKDIFTMDGKAHTHVAKNREAVVKALTQMSDLWKAGLCAPSALNWNDAGDNNAFHSKLCVMDFDGTISTELALFHNKAEYDDIMTRGLPTDDHGHPLPAQVGGPAVVIPKGAKNTEVAREFLEYAIQPEVLSEYCKGGLGRWAMPMDKFAKNDPFWGHNKDPHLSAYFQETLFGDTMADYGSYSPAVGQINAEHTFQVAFDNIVAHGMHPEAAADKALKRVDEIFAKYPV